MNDLIGKAVKWRHLKNDGTPVVNIRGKISALAGLDSSGRFKLVVQSPDGSLALLEHGDLIVSDRDFESLVEQDELESFYTETVPFREEKTVPVVEDIFETKNELNLVQIQGAMDSIGFAADSEAFAELPKESNTADRACFLLKTLFAELEDLSMKVTVMETELAKPKRGPGRPKKVPDEAAP